MRCIEKKEKEKEREEEKATGIPIGAVLFLSVLTESNVCFWDP